VSWITKYFFFIISLLLCLYSSAQQYNFQKYSIENGLPRSAVYSLHQDKDGFLWIGLDGGGVSVFDGENFKNFDMSDGLPSHDVRAVFEDSKGNIWFGTNAGLCKYDFDTIITYTMDEGLCYNYVRTITEDNDGNLWIGTDLGLSIYDGVNFSNYNLKDGLLDYKIRIIFKDSSGKMWVGTDSGINFLVNDVFIDYVDNYDLPHPTVLEIIEDSKNNIWIGTKSGLMKTNGEEITVFTTEDGLVNNRIRAICEDSYGDFWFGTRTGVSKYDGVNFVSFHEGNGLSHDRIRDIILDQKGNLWFATYFGGIDKFSTNDFVSLTKEEGLISNQVFSIFEDKKGDIILGTFDGVSKIKLKNGVIEGVQNVTSSETLLDDRVNTVVKDLNGFYWYGTHSGLSITNDKEVYHITRNEGLVDNEITIVYVSDSNNYWVGTEDGISKISFSDFPNKYTIENFEKDSNELIAGNEVSSILLDDFENLWFGFRDGTISILNSDGSFIKPQLNEKTYNITTIIKGIDNTLWVGTDANGLFKLDNVNDFGSKLNMLHYNKNDGLLSMHIYAMLLDSFNNLWLGTERGLDNILFDENRHLSTVNHYGTKEGLKGIEINERAVYLDHNNKLWFGTVEGASFLDNALFSVETTPPNLFITDIKLFGRKIESNNSFGINVDGRFQVPNDFLLPYNQNSLQFNFIGINLGASSKVKYKWKLEGFDNDWSEPLNGHIANYTNLPSGNYTFQVLSCNENDVWNETPTTLRFKITKPYWLTTWFITCSIILIIIIFTLLSQIRLQRLRKAKEALEKEILLATIQLRKEKELIEKQNNKIAFQKDQLIEINTSFTDSVNYAKRIQKAIMNHRADSLPNLDDNYFIFHRPKDIVSGDFFWFKDIGKSSYVTASDCTGHGVPGAFMSMIGMSFLNQIVAKSNSTIEPNDILFELRENVINALKHQGSEKSKDGMDMGLIRIDWDKMKVNYSGANNPLYHIRNGALTEVKANKMPIGEHDFMHLPFQLHSLELEKNDMIYIFSDGYADQFGGPKGKKFKYKPFKLFLESISNEPVEKQGDAIKNEFLDWMGEFEQIDDVLVIGIRI
jgi:ligand-binding sensor domain-containing protein/serine phosphatase RsbU (regulator of sigma subunit)